MRSNPDLVCSNSGKLNSPLPWRPRNPDSHVGLILIEQLGLKICLDRNTEILQHTCNIPAGQGCNEMGCKRNCPLGLSPLRTRRGRDGVGGERQDSPLFLHQLALQQTRRSAADHWRSCSRLSQHEHVHREALVHLAQKDGHILINLIKDATNCTKHMQKCLPELFDSLDGGTRTRQLFQRPPSFKTGTSFVLVFTREPKIHK